MKSIKFKNISHNQYYYFMIPLSILGVLLIFNNPFDLGIRENRIYGLIPILIGFLIVNNFFLPINIVEYSSDIIRIKINSLTKKAISFEEIKSVNLVSSELQIVLKDHKKLFFNLNNIDSISKNRLEKIFINNNN